MGCGFLILVGAKAAFWGGLSILIYIVGGCT
jgi:hypothetical protein